MSEDVSDERLTDRRSEDEISQRLQTGGDRRQAALAGPRSDFRPERPRVRQSQHLARAEITFAGKRVRCLPFYRQSPRVPSSTYIMYVYLMKRYFYIGCENSKV